jgi:hypothetical protein
MCECANAEKERQRARTIITLLIVLYSYLVIVPTTFFLLSQYSTPPAVGRAAKYISDELTGAAPFCQLHSCQLGLFLVLSLICLRAVTKKSHPRRRKLSQTDLSRVQMAPTHSRYFFRQERLVYNSASSTDFI